ncbi:hypothetical protein LWI29_032978 [Acer saccharum]|uniref:Uncharacterized protein n=1 Tax=Acer saccharum TaxID=4024 RepID=A0AA39VKA6_ACESA|nr:hypothetical protein LWI29_032978 [Acer saccharum]
MINNNVPIKTTVRVKFPELYLLSKEGSLTRKDLDPRVTVHYGIPFTASVLAFDPVQRLLAVGTLDGRIKVIGGNNIEELFVSPKQSPFKNLEVCESGFLVSVSNENEIQVWDLEHRRINSTFRWESNVTAFSVIHSTSYMYLGDEYGMVSVLKYDAEEESLHNCHIRFPQMSLLKLLEFHHLINLLFLEVSPNLVLRAYFSPETPLQEGNPNYEEKSPKAESDVPISLNMPISMSPESDIPIVPTSLSPEVESEVPRSLTEKIESTLKVYERQNKGKEKQGESVPIQVVQPLTSPSPTLVHQSDYEVENAPEVIPKHSTLSNDLSSENHTDSDPSLSTRRYPSREHRPLVRFGFSPERPPIDSKALYSITDYTLTHRLSETFKAFAHQLSSVSIPSKLQDALTDQNWVRAIEEEMKAL